MIGDNIRKLRLAKGLSMSALAKSISVSIGYLSDIEKGHKKNPSISFLNKIADALEVPLGYLMRTSVTAIIEDRLIELGASYEELSKKANIPDNYIENLDTISNLDESDYDRIGRIGLALNIHPDILISALAQQEPPVYDSPVVTLPSADFTAVDINDFVNIPIVGSVRAGKPILAQDNIEGYNLVPRRDLCTGKDYFYLRVQGDSMNLEFNDGTLLLIEKTPWVENGTIAVVLIDGLEATVKKVIQNENMITLIPMSSNPEHLPHMYDVVKDQIQIVGRVKQATKVY